MTNNELENIFNQLSEHYEEIGEEAWFNEDNLADDSMPFTVADLKRVYDSFATTDRFVLGSQAFSGENPMDKADTVDLINLFNELAEYYSREGSGNI